MGWFLFLGFTICAIVFQSWILFLTGIVVSTLMAGTAKIKRSESAMTEAKQEADRLMNEVTVVVSDVNRTRTLPVVTNVTVNLQPGEFAVLSQEAIIKVTHKKRVGGYLGSRVRVAGVPLYFGGYQSEPVEELVDAGQGPLVLTNQRLIFTSPQRTMVVDWKRLASIGADLHTLMVATTNAKTPYLFTVDNGILWEVFVGWMSKISPEKPQLPPNVSRIELESKDVDGQRQIFLTAKSNDPD